MTREEAILYLEHTSSDDFNLEEHQIQNRLNAIKFLLKENQELNKQLEDAEEELELIRCDLHNRTSERDGYERELHDFYFAKYRDLKQENKQLKDKWNKLEEYIKQTKLKQFECSYGKRYGKIFIQAEVTICNMILDIMQKIESEE